MDQNVSIMDFVFWKDVFYFFLIQVCEGLCTVESDTSELCWGNLNLRWRFVQSDTDFLQFSWDLNSVLFGFCSIQDHQDKIRIFGNGNDLSSSTFSFSGTFNDTGKIQKLDFGIIVVDDTRNAGQGGKFISCWEWLSVSDGAEESGFTDRGETNHAYSGVTESADFKSLSFGVFAFGFEKLGSQFG